jgi:hypothetical protein
MKNKRINEQPDYGGRPERMSRGLEDKLASPDSLYGSNPAMRKKEKDVQRLAYARFGKLADKLKEITGIQDISSSRVQQMIYGEMMSKMPMIMGVESRHKDRLIELAINSCLEETEIDPSWIEIEASLGSSIDTSNFRYSPEKQDDDDDDEEDDDEDGEGEMEFPSFDIDDLTPEEEFELEKHKRNIVNAIIQGAAKKGHYIFQKPEVKRELDQIDPRLYSAYLGIMAINDFMYFTMDDMIDMMSRTGSGIAGKVELDDSGGGDDDEDGYEGDEGDESPDTKIIAQGLIFPILCHEIIKGIEASKGRHGLPTDSKMSMKVKGQVDLLSNEPMQLRLGPEIVEKLRFSLPDDMFDPSNKGLINWFHIELYKLPAKEFLSIIGNVISDDSSKNDMAKRKFEEIMSQAKELKSEYENYKEENDIDSNDEDDLDGLDDFLSSLGISSPK